MTAINDAKTVLAELTWSPFGPDDGRLAAESVCLAPRRASLFCFGEESAGDLEGRGDVQIALVLPEVRQERDVFRMAHEPGGFMVRGVGSVVEGRDTKNDSQGPALRAHRAARWRQGSRRG